MQVSHKIKCECRVCHIRQTGRTLLCRIKEHRLLVLWSTIIEKSAVTDHSIQNQRTLFEETRNLHSERRVLNRMATELNIKKNFLISDGQKVFLRVYQHLTDWHNNKPRVTENFKFLIHIKRIRLYWYYLNWFQQCYNSFIKEL